MELIPSVSIPNLLHQRAAFRSRMLEAEALLEQAEEIYNASGIGKKPLSEDLYQINATDFWALGTHHFDWFSIKNRPTIQDALKGFDAVAWRMLMRESGMLTFMNSADRNAWDESILDKKTPELTLENIHATFSTLHGKRGEMMENGVLDLFRALSWEHKTNQPVKFGKKLILQRFGRPKAQKIDDLMRVLHIFDGKPQLDVRQNFSSKFNEFLGVCDFESEYADFRWCANGNMHIKINRADLVDKLNSILAKRFPDALPAPK